MRGGAHQAQLPGPVTTSAQPSCSVPSGTRKRPPDHMFISGGHDDSIPISFGATRRYGFSCSFSFSVFFCVFFVSLDCDAGCVVVADAGCVVSAVDVRSAGRSRAGRGAVFVAGFGVGAGRTAGCGFPACPPTCPDCPPTWFAGRITLLVVGVLPTPCRGDGATPGVAGRKFTRCGGGEDARIWFTAVLLSGRP